MKTGGCGKAFPMAAFLILWKIAGKCDKMIRSDLETELLRIKRGQSGKVMRKEETVNASDQRDLQTV